MKFCFYDLSMITVFSYPKLNTREMVLAPHNYYLRYLSVTNLFYTKIVFYNYFMFVTAAQVLKTVLIVTLAYCQVSLQILLIHEMLKVIISQCQWPNHMMEILNISSFTQRPLGLA